MSPPCDAAESFTVVSKRHTVKPGPPMIPHLQDVIVALSTPPGPGARAVVRLSGPGAVAVVERMCQADEPLQPVRRLLTAGRFRLPGVAAPLPADLYVMPAPRTYTGQELVEVH